MTRFINLTPSQQERYDDLVARLQVLDGAIASDPVATRRRQLQAELDELIAHADAIEPEAAA